MSSPGELHGSATGEHVREVAQGHEIPAGPDGAAFGDQGGDVVRQARHDQVHDGRAHAGVSAGQAVGPHQHGGPDDVPCGGGTSPVEVVTDHVALEFDRLGPAEVELRAVAESGGDAVDRAAGRNHLIPHLDRRGHARTGGGVQDGVGRPVGAGEARRVGRGQRVVAERDGQSPLSCHGGQVIAGDRRHRDVRSSSEQCAESMYLHHERGSTPTVILTARLRGYGRSATSGPDFGALLRIVRT